jgi:tryptophan-rich sensory protein
MAGGGLVWIALVFWMVLLMFKEDSRDLNSAWSIILDRHRRLIIAIVALYLAVVTAAILTAILAKLSR